MASVMPIATLDAVRRIRRVQTITIAWMGVEAAVSLVAAWRARSPALVAFGGDSAIELLSAAVVVRRFRINNPREQISPHRRSPVVMPNPGFRERDYNLGQRLCAGCCVLRLSRDL